MARLCKECKGEVPPEAKFCTQCGAAFVARPEVPEVEKTLHGASPVSLEPGPSETMHFGERTVNTRLPVATTVKAIPTIEAAVTPPPSVTAPMPMERVPGPTAAAALPAARTTQLSSEGVPQAIPLPPNVAATVPVPYSKMTAQLAPLPREERRRSRAGLAIGALVVLGLVGVAVALLWPRRVVVPVERSPGPAAEVATHPDVVFAEKVRAPPGVLSGTAVFRSTQSPLYLVASFSPGRVQATCAAEGGGSMRTFGGPLAAASPGSMQAGGMSSFGPGAGGAVEYRFDLAGEWASTLWRPASSAPQWTRWVRVAAVGASEFVDPE